MLFGIAAMIFIVTVLSLLSAANQLSLWHIAVGVFLSGMFWVLDFTVRRTSLGGSVSESSVGHAMGLDALTNNGTRALGPALAGIFIQWVGLTGVYVTSVVAYIVALLLTLTLRPRTKTTKLGDKSIMSSFRGIRPVLKAHPLLNGILMATLVLNLWGLPFIAMIPVIGKKILGLDAFYVGLLMSSEGCGALVGALLITSIGQVRHYRRIFASGMCLYLLAILVFSQSTALLTSVICLAFVGLGIAGFAAMQSALIILITPVASRGLMMGLVSMCIGLGAPLGLLHIGLLANWLGATHAVTILACQGAVATCFVFWKWPFLWNIQQLSKISKI